VLRELGLHLGDDFLAGIVVPLHAALVGAEGLAGKNSMTLLPVCSVFSMASKTVKRLKLYAWAADGDAADAVLRRDGGGAEGEGGQGRRGDRQRAEGGKEFHAIRGSAREPTRNGKAEFRAPGPILEK
jgi:hypothetical protein